MDSFLFLVYSNYLVFNIHSCDYIGYKSSRRTSYCFSLWVVLLDVHSSCQLCRLFPMNNTCHIAMLLLVLPLCKYIHLSGCSHLFFLHKLQVRQLIVNKRHFLCPGSTKQSFKAYFHKVNNFPKRNILL